MKMRRLLAILFICMLALSVSTAAFAASEIQNDEDTLNDMAATRDEAEPEYEWDGAANEPEESEYEDSYLTITGFSIVDLPSKTFTEPFVSEKMREAREASQSLQDGGKTLRDYLSKAAIVHNMDGAVIDIAFSDGSTYRLSFSDDDYWYYEDADYDYPLGFVMGWAYDSTFLFAIEDIGNYQARICFYDDDDDISAEIVFTAKSTAGGGSVTPVNHQSGENGEEPSISGTTHDQASTEAPAPATADQSSTNNGKVTANNQAMQTGANATAAYVAAAAAMLAGMIAIILKKKIFS